MIKVGFESKRLFRSMTGFGAYSRTLVKGLTTHYPDNRYVLLHDQSYEKASREPTFHTLDIQKVLNLDAVSVLYSPSNKSLYWKLLGAKYQLRSNHVDIYHGLTNQLPRSIRRAKIPLVITIHDLYYLHYPELSRNDLGQKDDLKKLNQELKEACIRSEKIIAVSESTKNDIVDQFSVSPDKVTVIYQSCDPIYFERITEEKKTEVRLRYDLPDKYLMYVGSMTERKNLLAIVKAIALIPISQRLPLIVIGARTAYTNVVVDYAMAKGLDKWLIFANSVSNNDMPAVYQGAHIFLYISLYEGFGIPVLEALVSGVPVITSNVSALPEAGGPNSRLVDPTDVEDIAKSIIDITRDKDLRSEMISKGRRYATRFESRVVSTQLMNCYKDMLHV